MSAVVDAFLGNGELTLGFFQDLLAYLKNDNNGIVGDILFASLKDYIEKVVKPHLRTVLEKSEKMDKAIADIPDEVKYADTPADS